jgi:iron complex outermembrane receptor protein
LPAGQRQHLRAGSLRHADRTLTDAVTAGASLQATSDAKLFGHDNRFIVGGSLDHSWTIFTSSSTLAFIQPTCPSW